MDIDKSSKVDAWKETIGKVNIRTHACMMIVRKLETKSDTNEWNAPTDTAMKPTVYATVQAIFSSMPKYPTHLIMNTVMDTK